MASEDNKEMTFNLFKNSTTNERRLHTHGTIRTTKRYRSTSLWLVLLLFLFSCGTAPKVPDAALMETGVPLDSGADVYILADVKKVRPIIDLLPFEELNDSQTKRMLERTDFLAAALFPQESGRRFQLAAWGNYPSFQAGMAFTFSRQWQKRRSETGQNYWYSGANGLSISLDSKQAFVAASKNDTPYYPATSAPGVEPPEGFNEFRAGSPLSCWMENPAPIINQMLGGAGIPIQIPARKIFINLFPLAEGRYEAAIRIQFESAVQARGIAAILTLAGSFISGEAGLGSILASILFANPPVQNDRSLDIRTASLSEAEIARLFSLFSDGAYT